MAIGTDHGSDRLLMPVMANGRIAIDAQPGSWRILKSAGAADGAQMRTPEQISSIIRFTLIG